MAALFNLVVRKAEGCARRSSHGESRAAGLSSFFSGLASLGFSRDEDEEEEEDDLAGGAGGISFAS